MIHLPSLPWSAGLAAFPKHPAHRMFESLEIAFLFHPGHTDRIGLKTGEHMQHHGQQRIQATYML